MKPVRAALALPLALLLAGCGDSGTAELQQWMDGVKRQTKSVVPKIEPPKTFHPFAYGGEAAVDPFDPGKLAAMFASQKAVSGNSLKPDSQRRREPLEAWPLDALKMVGLLQKGGVNFALVQADRTVFHVKQGNYLGQNFGKIARITETEVQLKEVVQDAAGDWVERDARLELQENQNDKH
ncbi:MAG: pilus assembly protein PilP [Noviherbaspirillum sp.]